MIFNRKQKHRSTTEIREEIEKAEQVARAEYDQRVFEFVERILKKVNRRQYKIEAGGLKLRARSGHVLHEDDVKPHFNDTNFKLFEMSRSTTILSVFYPTYDVILWVREGVSE